MKKILFITPQNPEKLDAGDKKYSWDVLKAIKYKNDVYIHVLSFLQCYEKNNHYCKLEEFVDKVTYVPFESISPLRRAISIYPVTIAHRRSKKMTLCLKEILSKEDYDVIVVNMFKMSYYISQLSHYPGRKIYISHNVETQVSKSIYDNTTGLINKIAYLLDYYKTKYWERRFLSYFDAITAICDCDAKMLVEITGKENVTVIRPLVYVKPFTQLHDHSNKLIICGTFKWLPKIINIQNVFRCKNISLLKERGKHLMVVGKAHKSVLNEGNKIKGVIITGLVDSVDPYYQKAEVALIPEQSGGGFKLKIAEAVQYHIPIVAIKGAVTDNQMIPNIHYIEAENYDDLIIKGIELIDNRKKQEYLVRNEIELFSQNYSIDNVNTQIIGVLTNR